MELNGSNNSASEQTMNVPIPSTGTSHDDTINSGNSHGVRVGIAQPNDNTPSPRIVSSIAQPYDDHSQPNSRPEHSPSTAVLFRAAQEQIDLPRVHPPNRSFGQDLPVVRIDEHTDDDTNILLESEYAQQNNDVLHTTETSFNASLT